MDVSSQNDDGSRLITCILGHEHGHGQGRSRGEPEEEEEEEEEEDAAEQAKGYGDDPGDASPLTPPFLDPLEAAWKPAYFGGRGQPALCSAAPKLPRPSPDDGTMETSALIRVNLWLKTLP
ncbi:hypothetical protein S7711_10427 [Stachybotrys chartarum IBT 7711]|uniref:Uncharacterized protein n=1 Tax=Stachybotrys chartarum (strain CBS 109288 / IBT 7711) TaxID=1280523 RepID=A0A084ASW9_STACB|nr:hypothetical protein S7711_10427 [Stachybotrys chartarum IBT 7711]